MKTLQEIMMVAQNKPNKTIALACPEDHEVLQAVDEATRLNLCDFVLFGDEAKTKTIAEEMNINLDKCQFVNVLDKETACFEAVKYVSQGHADVLMKGLVDTAVIMKKVLDKDYGLRTDNIISHVMVIQLPKFDRLIFLSDGAMNIDPTIEQLKQITINAVKLARSLSINRPKVACISAVEKVNPKMPSTVKCHEIEQMQENLEIVHCDICGPMAIDIALDKEAAKTKNIKHPVAGNADILIVPYIEVGNALYKGWMFGCENVKSAGIIMGAKAPIVLTSRADSHESKLYSIALSVLLDNM
ncbi:MAG TPA: bifunctional enoyl-CoA hydratase/phosphate acetyltransferase [Haloplasmataceae bacterium]|jgi:phosphate butyryltransferase